MKNGKQGKLNQTLQKREIDLQSIYFFSLKLNCHCLTLQN